MPDSYKFAAIEKKWQAYWAANPTFRAEIDTQAPKYYVLDMFPYPSGQGLHVGHALGYIASDVIARYKKSKGYNVLHPMGFDAFGLPAEQYAIQTGQHPTTTIAQNIQQYKSQLKQMGLGYDWDREIHTCAPNYYRWTQWIFLQLFESWYDTCLQKAQPIAHLITTFAQSGNAQVAAACDAHTPTFTAQAWQQMTAGEQEDILLKYRLAFLSETTVNWCPALGTVLANEEVKDGFSERGGHPVVPKRMQQWHLRITAYADRLLADLEGLDWPASTKAMQRHWIGRSWGMHVTFAVQREDVSQCIAVFTTRPETLFGVTYIALSTTHPLLDALTTQVQRPAVEAYLASQQADAKKRTGPQPMTGVFTGSYALHPLTDQPLPIWIADYVVPDYGTCVIMGVPAHDSRDHAFAKAYGLPIVQVIDGPDVQAAAYEEPVGTLVRSGFLNGLAIQDAAAQVVQKVEAMCIGSAQTTYRLRDAVFSRQRYWGEPFPIFYKDNRPCALAPEELPLVLPTLATYQPTDTGQPPLSRAPHWETAAGYPLELHTMPSWAASSWYFFRYMDPHNADCWVGAAAQAYWRAVDLYVGGTEHTTGHLLYARFWTKFLYDLGHVSVQEPFQRLLHQGMVQKKASLVYRVKNTHQFVSYNLRHSYDTVPMYVPIDQVENDMLDIAAFKKWRPELSQATFVLENGQYICGSQLEKMSKSKHNVVNPNRIIDQYGADTLRLYTLFLGPIDQSKPWDTHGIKGIYRFLNKVWGSFHEPSGALAITEQTPSVAALQVLHKTIQQVEEALQRYTFNTAISTLMICVNKLNALGCKSKQVWQDFTLLLAPFAPHLAEELWELLGQAASVALAPFPQYDAQYVQAEATACPVAVNGKVRAKIMLQFDRSDAAIEEAVLHHEKIQKWIAGKQPKRVLIVPHKMVNVVV
ncbi:MAG: leucine--tRNA ligase [Bacteroidota bacterium]